MGLISWSSKYQDEPEESDWYDPGECRCLLQSEINALASGGTVSPLAYEHYSSCYDCQRAVSRAEKEAFAGYGLSGFSLGRKLREYESRDEPSLDRHLSLAEVQAIAEGLSHTVNPLALQHYHECGECSRAVNRTY